MKKRIVSIIVIIGLFSGLGVYLDRVYSVPVLMYHNIACGQKQSRLDVNPKSFERQMRFLKEQGYNVLALGDYLQMIKEGKKPQKKSVVITFDDGYRNNYSDAYPILKKYKIPATIFVVTNWVGKDKMMDWQMIQKAQQSGLIEIGSHTLSHATLPELNKENIILEIKESKFILESKLNTSIRFISYPCGFFNAFIKETVKQAGYLGACATTLDKSVALDDIYAIRRIRISNSADSMFIFWTQVSGYYTFFKDRRIKKK